MEVSSSEAVIWSVEKDFFLQIVKCEMRERLIERFNLQDTNVPLKDLNLVRVIGVGGSGVVRLMERKMTKVRYALKRVKEIGGMIPPAGKHGVDLIFERSSLHLARGGSVFR